MRSLEHTRARAHRTSNTLTVRARSRAPYDSAAVPASTSLLYRRLSFYYTPPATVVRLTTQPPPSARYSARAVRARRNTRTLPCTFVAPRRSCFARPPSPGSSTTISPGTPQILSLGLSFSLYRSAPFPAITSSPRQIAKRCPPVHDR